MSYLDRDKARARGLHACSMAITALTGAGAVLVDARDPLHPEGANELITALRDDIKTMVGDVEALQKVIQGR